MSGKQDKKLRKENQIQRKQLSPMVAQMIERMTRQPFKIRWRLALKILMGTKK